MKFPTPVVGRFHDCQKEFINGELYWEGSKEITVQNITLIFCTVMGIDVCSVFAKIGWILQGTSYQNDRLPQ